MDNIRQAATLTDYSSKAPSTRRKNRECYAAYFHTSGAGEFFLPTPFHSNEAAGHRSGRFNVPCCYIPFTSFILLLPRTLSVSLSTSCALQQFLYCSCYGDYCQYCAMPPSPSGENSVQQGTSFADENCPASKLVPYRSILKARAEEKALKLTLTLQTQTDARRGEAERLPILQCFGETESCLDKVRYGYRYGYGYGCQY